MTLVKIAPSTGGNDKPAAAIRTRVYRPESTPSRESDATKDLLLLGLELFVSQHTRVAELAELLKLCNVVNRRHDRVLRLGGRRGLGLARRKRRGSLIEPPIRVPSITEEAARDLVRAREDVRGDLMRARHRVSKLLLRHGHVYSGGQAWTGKHEQWLGSIRFDQTGTQAAFDADREAVDFAVARRARLDTAIAAMAADSEFTAMTRRLCCLRGISTLTGFALAVELGDWERFTGASIGAYLGLVPSEHSSGDSRRQGGITKTGNTHARRLLIEAAWHHKPRYKVGAVLQARWDQATPAARARAHLGNQRLHHQWTKYATRRKKHTVANTAIARELAGWCWSLATLE